MTRYPIVIVCMVSFVVACAGVLRGNAAAAQSTLICNQGAYNAHCLLVGSPNDNVGYNRFVIPANHYQKVDMGTQVRCAIDIDPAGNSSTWLNYFVTNQKGVYTLMFQSVPYGQGTRYATVVAFEPAKRIKYTITNATAFPIDILFLPNQNKAHLDPGKKTSCNSPVRNGELPVVQASSPTGGVYAIPIARELWNYTVLPHGQNGLGVVIVPQQN